MVIRMVPTTTHTATIQVEMPLLLLVSSNDSLGDSVSRTVVVVDRAVDSLPSSDVVTVELSLDVTSVFNDVCPYSFEEGLTAAVVAGPVLGVTMLVFSVASVKEATAIVCVVITE